MDPRRCWAPVVPAQVANDKNVKLAVLLDTKGPEVRTAMLRGGKDIELVAGEIITVVAVGAKYETYEGFRDEATGQVTIGLSYAKLCRDVKVGGRILIGDGQVRTGRVLTGLLDACRASKISSMHRGGPVQRVRAGQGRPAARARHAAVSQACTLLFVLPAHLCRLPWRSLR